MKARLRTRWFQVWLLWFSVDLTLIFGPFPDWVPYAWVLFYIGLCVGHSWGHSEGIKFMHELDEEVEQRRRQRMDDELARRREARWN